MSSNLDAQTQQRGDDPSNVHKEPQPTTEPNYSSTQEERNAILQRIRALSDKNPPKRPNSIWPYLLIRAYPGDHGVRQPPIYPPTAFWESPDVLVVPGNVTDLSQGTPTLNPVVGQPHTVFVRVWNLGKLSAIGVKLSVYWANPAFSFDDPTPEPPHFVGGIYLNLPNRSQPDCHQVFRIPQPWVPVEENGGHECMLAKVDAFSDRAGSGYDTNTDRHVGQKNVFLASPTTDLSPLLQQLSVALPKGADLQLFDGTKDLRPLLLAQGKSLVGRYTIGTGTKATFATQTATGETHLGAIMSVNEATHFVPASVMASTGPAAISRAATAVTSPTPTLTAARIAAVRAPGVTPTASAQTAATDVMSGMNLQNYQARTIALKLGGQNEAHLLRFVATQGGKVLGGYSVIVVAQ